MEKKDIMKLIVLIGAAVMVGSMFAPALFFKSDGGNSGPAGEMVSGIAVFNGTIRTYDPILVVTGELPDSVKSGLQLDERVKSVTSSAEGHIINITTRDDVYPLAGSLKDKGIVSTTVANIILPSSLELELSNGSRIEVISAGTVKLWTEPLVDADTEVLIRMVGTVQDGRLISYSSPVLLAETISLSGNATIASIEGKEYTFSVPWEERDQIDEASLESLGDTEYTRRDYISFPSGLSVMQITEKSDLEYISFISDTGASVYSNFTDMNRVLSDFGNITVVFPESKLSIVSNETVDLPHNSTILFRYSIELPQSLEGYIIDSRAQKVRIQDEYPINDTVDVTVNGTAIGNRIVDIEGIQVR